MKIVWFWLAWVALYLATHYAGDWYYAAFNLHNSLASLALLAASLVCAEGWVLKAFVGISIARIALEAADAVADLPIPIYDGFMTAYNVLEFCVIFIFGGIMTLRQWLHESAGNADNSGHSPTDRR